MIDAPAEGRFRLYVRSGCPFSPRAIERMTRLAEEDARIRFDIHSLDRDEPSDPGAPIVTPSLERLRGILARFLGELVSWGSSGWGSDPSKNRPGVANTV